LWSGGRGTHVLSGTAPFYGVYECADGGWFSVGAIEPPFYAAFLEVVAPDEPAEQQWEQNRWPALRAQLAKAFQGRTRDEWTAAFAAVDACAEPVLDVDGARPPPAPQGRGGRCGATTIGCAAASLPGCPATRDRRQPSRRRPTRENSSPALASPPPRPPTCWRSAQWPKRQFGADKPNTVC